MKRTRRTLLKRLRFELGSAVTAAWQLDDAIKTEMHRGKNKAEAEKAAIANLWKNAHHYVPRRRALMP